MSREVRRVPKDWQHPTLEDGSYRPLYDGAGLARRMATWDEDNAQWQKGLRRDFDNRGKWVPRDRDVSTFEDWDGPRPDPRDYMPDWPEAERTHLQMYESVTEGTPISPVLATAEELARWCADNRASAFAGRPASYEAWLAVCRTGSTAGSAFLNVSTGEITSSVDAELKLNRR